MGDFWNTIAGISGDTSVGDSAEQIKEAGKDADKDGAKESNDGWANESVDGGSNVADSSDHGASMNYSR